MTTTLSQSIQPQARTIDGLSIRYAESEPRDDQALLLSPWPESIYCYEPDDGWEGAVPGSSHDVIPRIFNASRRQYDANDQDHRWNRDLL